MESLFDGFFGSIESLRQAGAADRGVDAALSGISSGMWAPRVERWESDDAVHILAHLPNVASDQVCVDTNTPGRLKLYSECCAHTAYDSGRDRVRERRLGQFEKDIPLPPGVRIAEMVVAAHEPGGVAITIPKSRAGGAAP
ncbi:hypothetical protein LPJ61_000193 [Coemansia biformis]|uniref:SHSP domain-containing protein n=1 Tax=Coemansia biformis TaxID=1286918 RepID=A0A9W7YJ38_9FUNG|nr:hypothetical protein LPJ61_000193 [Coemansia biformis]